MSKITWKKLREAEGVCKDGIFSFPDAVRAATVLALPNWEKALGKMVAHIHPKAKDYYEDEVIYLHNQKALEEGRLTDIDREAVEAAARAAVRAADAAYWAAARTIDGPIWYAALAATRAGATAKWVAKDADAATWAARAAATAEWAARAADMAADWSAWAAAGAARAAEWAAKDADDLNILIDIYFDALEEL